MNTSCNSLASLYSKKDDYFILGAESGMRSKTNFANPNSEDLSWLETVHDYDSLDPAT